jgi:hypothetical protein
MKWPQKGRKRRKNGKPGCDVPRPTNRFDAPDRAGAAKRHEMAAKRRKRRKNGKPGCDVPRPAVRFDAPDRTGDLAVGEETEGDNTFGGGESWQRAWELESYRLRMGT